MAKKLRTAKTKKRQEVPTSTKLVADAREKFPTRAALEDAILQCQAKMDAAADTGFQKYKTAISSAEDELRTLRPMRLLLPTVTELRDMMDALQMAKESEMKEFNMEQASTIQVEIDGLQDQINKEERFLLTKRIDAKVVMKTRSAESQSTSQSVSTASVTVAGSEDDDSTNLQYGSKGENSIASMTQDYERRMPSDDDDRDVFSLSCGENISTAGGDASKAILEFIAETAPPAFSRAMSKLESAQAKVEMKILGVRDQWRNAMEEKERKLEELNEEKRQGEIMVARFEAGRSVNRRREELINQVTALH